MANEPIQGSIAIAGVKPGVNGDGQLVPIKIVIDDAYNPPRLLVHSLATVNDALPGIYTESYDANAAGEVIYQGWAVPGTAKSSAAWAIVKFTYASGIATDKQWAGGSATFNQIWDNRASLSYS